MIWKALALLAAATAFAQPAYAQAVTAANPNSVVQALQSAGYTATLTTDEYGDPKIQSASSGSNFSVFFFGCTDGRNCSSIQFHSSYEITPPAPQRFADWNRTKRYARGFVSANNASTIEMDINLDGGSISRALLVDSLELWATLMSDFEEMVGWQG
jgi:hypothetical protein